MLLAIDRFSFAALKPVGVAALGPGVGSAHADEVALVPGALAEAALRRPDRVVAAFAPHRHQESGADLSQPPVLLLVTVGLRLDAAVERRLVQVPQANRAMYSLTDAGTSSLIVTSIE